MSYSDVVRGIPEGADLFHISDGDISSDYETKYADVVQVHANLSVLSFLSLISVLKVREKMIRSHIVIS